MSINDNLYTYSTLLPLLFLLHSSSLSSLPCSKTFSLTPLSSLSLSLFPFLLHLIDHSNTTLTSLNQNYTPLL